MKTLICSIIGCIVASIVGASIILAFKIPGHPISIKNELVMWDFMFRCTSDNKLVEFYQWPNSNYHNPDYRIRAVCTKNATSTDYTGLDIKGQP